MREIEVSELSKVIDVFKIKEAPAIAMATDGKETNGLTIGWASYGVLWSKKCATVYVHKVRYSKHIFDNAEYYSINYLPDEYKKQLGYFGRVSGKDEDKIKGSGLTLVEDLAPYFAENKVTVICRVMGKSDFDINFVDKGVKEWYDEEGVHSQYYGEIVKVLIND